MSLSTTWFIAPRKPRERRHPLLHYKLTTETAGQRKVVWNRKQSWLFSLLPWTYWHFFNGADTRSLVQWERFPENVPHFGSHWVTLQQMQTWDPNPHNGWLWAFMALCFLHQRLKAGNRSSVAQYLCSTTRSLDCCSLEMPFMKSNALNRCFSLKIN